MKKIILFSVMCFSSLCFSQSSVKAFVSKETNLTYEQYDLIKAVNQYNSDILVSKVAVNNYWSDLKQSEPVESYLKYTMPSDCDLYEVRIYPDNTQLDYTYKLKTGVLHYGHVNLFGGSVIRVDYEVNNGKISHTYKVNDKIVNTLKN